VLDGGHLEPETNVGLIIRYSPSFIKEEFKVLVGFIVLNDSMTFLCRGLIYTAMIYAFRDKS
jgi:hypothetical protein